MKEIEVGDYVKVVNDGLCYPNYETWAREHCLTGFVRGDGGVYLNSEEEYQVVVKGSFSPTYTQKILLGIKARDGQEFIIDQEGVEKISDKPTAQQELKDILKPFMRVELRNGSLFIVANSPKQPENLIGVCVGGWLEEIKVEESNKFGVVKVYDAPSDIKGYLNPYIVGNLVWSSKKLEIETKIEALQEEINKLEEQLRKIR